MGESRSFDLAAVGSAGAVGHQVNAELPLRVAHKHTHTQSYKNGFGFVWGRVWGYFSDLWRLHGGVRGAWGDLVTLRVQLKMVDQRLHRRLGRESKGHQR